MESADEPGLLPLEEQVVLFEAAEETLLANLVSEFMRDPSADPPDPSDVATAMEIARQVVRRLIDRGLVKLTWSPRHVDDIQNVPSSEIERIVSTPAVWRTGILPGSDESTEWLVYIGSFRIGFQSVSS
jgi:hypothetical protein